MVEPANLRDMRKLVSFTREKIPELAVPLMLVCATGIRRGEMVKLKKVDFDPKRGTIIVKSAKQSRSEQVTYRPIVLAEDVRVAFPREFAQLTPVGHMLVRRQDLP